MALREYFVRLAGAAVGLAAIEEGSVELSAEVSLGVCSLGVGEKGLFSPEEGGFVAESEVCAGTEVPDTGEGVSRVTGFGFAWQLTSAIMIKAIHAVGIVGVFNAGPF